MAGEQLEEGESLMNAFADFSCFERDRQHSASQDAIFAIRRLDEEERFVLAGIAAGLSRKQLARELGIADEKMAMVVGELFEKIGARVTADAVRIALLAGL